MNNDKILISIGGLR